MTRRRWVAVGATVVALLVALPLLWWNTIGPERVENLQLGVVPSPRAAAVASPHETSRPLDLGPDVRVYLLFSTGSSGVSAEDAQRLRINDLETRGGDRLTDTMMLLILDPASRQAGLLSIPRDLWLYDRGHRINATFAKHGTQALIDDVSAITGLPIHHLVQVNFTAFADLIDAVGGVAVRIDRPLADLEAVLYVPEAGCWMFDGAAALAYARARHTLTVSGDTWRNDPTASDFGRMDRQRALLGAAWDQVRGPGIVTRIPDLLGLASGLRIDAALGVGDVVDLARAFADVTAGRVEGYTLPTTGRRIGGAAAQVLRTEEAAPILRRLRSWPPDVPVAPATPTELPIAEPPTIPADASCNRDVAIELPEPRGPLADVAEGRVPTWQAPGDEPPDPGSPSTDPTGTTEPTEEPGPGPEPTTTDEPSPAPEPAPLPTLAPPTLPGGSR